MTKNEEANLLRVLDSLPGASRVLVVDSESSDATVPLARSRGAQVVVRPWGGFVETRRFALGHVETPWTFMLDADETLDPNLRDAIGAAEPQAETGGYVMRRTTFFCGRPIVGCGWGEEAPLRLFRTRGGHLVAHPAGGGQAELHEEWQVDGRVERLAGELLHDSYPTVAAYWDKFHRYTSLEAQSMRPSWFVGLGTLLTALARLPYLFLVKRGYRDGWRGAIIAAGSAFYPVAVLWKAARR